MGTGMTIVAVYANRENSPARQVENLLHMGEKAAKGGDKQKARQLTQQAYTVATAVSINGILTTTNNLFCYAIEVN